MSILKTYISLVGLRATSLIMAGVFVVVVAAYVPTESFGRFSLIMSILQVLGGGVLSFGNHALLRYGREDFITRESIGTVLAARLVVHSALLLCLIVSIWLFFPFVFEKIDLSPDTLPFIFAGLIIIPLSEMGTFALQAFGRFTGFGMSPVIFRGVQLSTLGLMVLLSITSWTWMMAGTLIGHLSAGIYTWTKLPKNSVAGLTTNIATIRRLITFGWSIPLATLSVTLVTSMDLWFIEIYHGSSATGSYAWAYSISLLVTALLAPLGAVLVPNLIDHISSKNDKGYSRIIRGSHGIVILAMSIFPAVAGTAFALSGVLEFGAYHAAVIPGVILIGAAAFQLGTNMWEPMALATDGHVQMGVFVIFSMALINALGDWMLVPSLGGTGAAVSTSASFLFGAIGLYATIRGRVSSLAMPGWISLVAVGGVSLAAVFGTVFLLSPTLGAAFGWAISSMLVALVWWYRGYAGLAVLRTYESSSSRYGSHLINALAGFGESCKQGR